MPDNNPYPVFLFFGIYGLLALIHVFKTLRESDGRTYDEIIASFKWKLNLYMLYIVLQIIALIIIEVETSGVGLKLFLNWYKLQIILGR